MKTRRSPPRSAVLPSDEPSRRQFMLVGARIVAPAVLLPVLAAAGCGAADAQTPGNIPRVGFLAPGAAAGQPRIFLAAFQKGLRDHGWVEGATLVVETRFAEGKFERIPELVAELARLEVRAIFVLGSPAASIARRHTTIPLVMIGDPVGTKLAATLDRPGGTVTGLASNSQEICGKRLTLLKAVVPGLTRVAFIANPDSPATPGILRSTQNTAMSLDIELIDIGVRTEREIEGAFDTMGRMGVQGFIFYPVPMVDSRVTQLAEIAVQRRIAWMDEIPRNATLGALLGYGADYPELARRAADYIDRIVKGADPAVLAIGVPEKAEFVVNLKTAQALGTTVPESVLAEARTVIR